MTFIPIPNSMTLCFNFETNGSLWQFCLTVKKSAGAPTSTDLSNVAAIGEDYWTNELKAQTNDGTTLNEIVVTDQTSQGAPQFVSTISEAGAAAIDPLPSGSPMCISLRTAKRGRSYRGRVYISGRNASELVTPNFWQSATVTALVSGLAQLQDDLDFAGYDVVVASKQHNGAPTNPAETNEVIAITADAAVDSQRRRLAGRGT